MYDTRRDPAKTQSVGVVVKSSIYCCFFAHVNESIVIAKLKVNHSVITAADGIAIEARWYCDMQC